MSRAIDWCSESEESRRERPAACSNVVGGFDLCRQCDAAFANEVLICDLRP